MSTDLDKARKKRAKTMTGQQETINKQKSQLIRLRAERKAREALIKEGWQPPIR